MNNKEIRYDFKPGYVYAIEFGDKIKIGKSGDFKTRIKQLGQTAKYAGVKIGNYIKSPKCYNYSYMETYIHEIFKNYRIDGTELFDGITLEEVNKVMNNCTWETEKPKQIIKAEKRMDTFISDMRETKEKVVKCLTPDNADFIHNHSTDSFERFKKVYEVHTRMKATDMDYFQHCRYFIVTEDGNRFFSDRIIASDNAILLHSFYYNYIYLEKDQIVNFVDFETDNAFMDEEFFDNIEENCGKCSIEYNDVTCEEISDYVQRILNNVCTYEDYPVISGKYCDTNS